MIRLSVGLEDIEDIKNDFEMDLELQKSQSLSLINEISSKRRGGFCFHGR